MGRLSLLKEANVSMKEIYALTKGVNLNAKAEDLDAEAQRYSAMLEKREPLVQKAVQLKKQANAHPPMEDAVECEKVWRTVKELIKKTDEAEKNNVKIIRQIMESTKSSIKDLKDGAKLISLYAKPPGDFTSGRLDVKK